MKPRLLSLFLFVAAVGFYADAQKAVKFEFSASEARALDMSPATYVKPLVAEVKVDESQGRIRDSWILTNAGFNSRVIQGDDAATIRNLQIYGMFKSSEKHNCDLIVAPTFDIHVDNSGATITVVGYPANFTKWATSTAADYDWIKMTPGGSTQPVEPLPNITITKE